jgi:hypothetical protein
MVNMKYKDSPSTTQRVIVEQSSKKSIALSTPSFLSLARKSGKSDVPLTVLEQVYARGLLESVPSSKNTPEQQAFHRVESFIHRGKAYELDQDLITEIPKVPDGSKSMYIIKNAIKNHEERNKPLDESIGSFVGNRLKRAILGGPRGGGLFVTRKSRAAASAPSTDDIVQRNLQRKEIQHKTQQEWEKLHPELGKKAKDVQRTKSTIRSAEATGKKLSGHAAEVRDRWAAKGVAHAAAERGREQEYVMKKTGVSQSRLRGGSPGSTEAPLSKPELTNINQARKDYQASRKRPMPAQGAPKPQRQGFISRWRKSLNPASKVWSGK